jgi:hypothetical protein
MTLKTAPPAIIAILSADPTRCDEFRVACCADVVVAWLGVWHLTDARETVIACRRGLDEIVTDIARRDESKRFEIAKTGDAWQD